MRPKYILDGTRNKVLATKENESLKLTIFSLTFPASLVRECHAAPVGDQASLLTQARKLKDLVTKLSALRLDHTEFTCLKAIILFNPGTDS